jgi:hypothetical protein
MIGDHGKNRLVMRLTNAGQRPGNKINRPFLPPAMAAREALPPGESQDDGGGGGGDGAGGLDLDPLLIALLKKIPSAEKGWPGPSRVRWFRTFAMNVSQIYDSETEPVEMKIEVEAAK